MFPRPRRKPNAPEHAESALPAAEEYRPQLQALVERADAVGLPVSLVVCAPQRLPAEDTSRALDAGAALLPIVVRDDDVAGYVDSEYLGVALFGAGPTAAGPVAFRLKGDLGMHTARLGVAVWRAGFASFPANARDADELVLAAIESARGDRARQRDVISLSPEKLLEAAIESARRERGPSP